MTASLYSVETNSGSSVRMFRQFIEARFITRETEKPMVVDCRPQFYLSLEGYCFSRSYEGE